MVAFLGLAFLLGAEADPLPTIPFPVKEETVDIFLYTRNTLAAQKVEHDLSNLNGTDFDHSRPKTIVILHGWTNDISFAEHFVPGNVIPRFHSTVLKYVR